MSDCKWGFQQEYGHKTVPCPWQQTSGYSFFDGDPLRKKNFRSPTAPVYMEDCMPKTTNYTERPQSPRWSMSVYGCHREMPWTSSLRSVRNPFPGRLPSREARYQQEPSPASPAASTAVSLTPSSPAAKRFKSAPGTPRPSAQGRRILEQEQRPSKPSSASASPGENRQAADGQGRALTPRRPHGSPPQGTPRGTPRKRLQRHLQQQQQQQSTSGSSA